MNHRDASRVKRNERKVDVALLGDDFILQKIQMCRTLSRPSCLPKRSDFVDRLSLIAFKCRSKFEEKIVRLRSRPAAINAALLAVIEKFRRVQFQFLTENLQQLPIRLFTQ